MTKQEVIDLMRASKSVTEWDANADTVKTACGGYPEFWWSAIIQSGLADRTAAYWGGDAKLHVQILR